MTYDLLPVPSAPSPPGVLGVLAVCIVCSDRALCLSGGPVPRREPGDRETTPGAQKNERGGRCAGLLPYML